MRSYLLCAVGAGRSRGHDRCDRRHGSGASAHPDVLLGTVGSGLVLIVGLVMVLPILGGLLYGMVAVPVALVGLVAMYDAAVEGSRASATSRGSQTP